MPLKTVGEFTASLWLTRVLLTYHFTYLEQMSKVPLTPSQTTSAVIFCLNWNVWQGGMSLALRCIMSDQESVILPHRNIQSSSGTLRFQFFRTCCTTSSHSSACCVLDFKLIVPHLYQFIIVPQLFPIRICCAAILIVLRTWSKGSRRWHHPQFVRETISHDLNRFRRYRWITAFVFAYMLFVRRAPSNNILPEDAGSLFHYVHDAKLNFAAW